MQEQCVCAQEKSAETKEKAADGTAAEEVTNLSSYVTGDASPAQGISKEVKEGTAHGYYA